jgi:pimeloyl-ACP methyl ester carboxylesterase
VSDAFVDIDGMTIATRSFGGSGRSLLLVHGGADTLESWNEIGAALTKTFRVVAFDMRGHGCSSVPTTLTMDDLLSEIKGVGNALRLKEPILVGHGFGAGNCLRYASMADADCAGVIASDPGPWRTGEQLPPWGLELVAAQEYGWEGTRDDLEAALAKCLECAPDGASPTVVEANFRRARQESSVGRFIRKPPIPYVQRMGELPRMQENQLGDELFAAISRPVRLVCGTTGLLGQARGFAESLPAVYPNVTVTFLDAGRYVHWQRNKEVTQEIVRFAQDIAS